MVPGKRGVYSKSSKVVVAPVPVAGPVGEGVMVKPLKKVGEDMEGVEVLWRSSGGGGGVSCDGRDGGSLRTINGRGEVWLLVDCLPG